MHTVRIDKLKLLDTLRTNRSKHIADYTLALSGYLTTALERLANRTTSVNHFIIRLSESLPYTANDIPVLLFSDRPPEDHTAEYDTAIAKLTYSVDSFIELDNQQFQQLVLDNWDWSKVFNATKALYSNTK